MDGKEGCVKGPMDDLTSDLFDRLGEGTVMIDKDCAIVRMNYSFREILEYGIKDQPINLLDMIWNENRDLFLSELGKIRGGYSGPMGRFRLKNSKGEERWIEPMGTRMDTQEGTFYFLVVKEITDKVLEEEIIGRTQSMVSTLMGNLPGMAFRSYSGPERTMDFVSEGCVDLTGYTPDELTMEIQYGDLIDERDRDVVIRTIEGSIRDGNIYEMIYRLKTRDETEKWVWEKGRGFPGTTTSPPRIEGFLLDTTARKEMEVKLETYRKNLEILVSERTSDLITERNRLSATLSSIGDGVITADVEGKVLMMNTNAEVLLDRKSDICIGTRIVSLISDGDPDREEEISRYMSGSEKEEVAGDHPTTSIMVERGERILEIKSSILQDESGGRTGYVMAIRDVTERRKMEEEVAKNQRLESIGVLAGGIAHDFNNMLTSLLGNIALARTSVESDVEALTALEDAEKAAYNARNLTSQLLIFSRGGDPVKKEVDLDQILRDSCRFSLSGSRVTHRIMIEDRLWKVELDESQFKQALSNILINAKESMPDGGIVTIRAENIELKKSPGNPLREGRYVRVSISDKGSGMSKHVLKKVFDPYFSTKNEGRGMGLATSFSIIKEHFGLLEATSTVNKGSTFIVHLPAIGHGEDNTQITSDVKKKQSGEHILLMDDDVLLLNAISKLLGNMGYSIDTAEDGMKAVAMYHRELEKGTKYDAIILDITVPGGMGGEEALRRIMDFDPGAKAIVSSGYSNDPIMAHFERYGFKGVIRKPYKIEDLKTEIGRVIYGI